MVSLLLRILYHHPKNVPVFQPHHVARLSSGLTVVITGANSGLGYETVKHLLLGQASPLHHDDDNDDDNDDDKVVMPEPKHSVIVMACRSMIKCEAARQRLWSEVGIIDKTTTNSSTPTTTTIIVTMQLDLERRESIARFARELPKVLNAAIPSPPSSSDAQQNATCKSSKDVAIDVLINNAGVFARSETGVVYHNDSRMDEHILVNHLGHVQLMHHLWPKLLRDGTRIVAISSISALLPIDTTDEWYGASIGPRNNVLKLLYPSLARRIMTGLVSYGRSKRANMLFAHELHRRYGHLGISAVASHPGIASTNIWMQGGKIFPSLLANFFHNATIMTQSSSEGAATQLWAALDRTNVPSGWYVGPRWWFKGPPILLGPIVGNNEERKRKNYLDIPHFWPFSIRDGERLFDQSLQDLGIAEFGRYGGESDA